MIAAVKHRDLMAPGDQTFDEGPAHELHAADREYSHAPMILLR